MICVHMNAGIGDVMSYVLQVMTIVVSMSRNISRQNYNDYMSITRQNNIISIIMNGNGYITKNNVIQLLMHSIIQHNGLSYVIT